MLERNSIVELAKEHGTPFYLFDMKILHERLVKIQKDFGDKVQLCYAMKANPFLVKELKDTDIFFEVCSPGEFAICKRAKVQMEHVILSGVNKYAYDVEDAIDHGVKIITAESEKHFSMIMEEAKRANAVVQVILRLTSGNQFGMDADCIERCIEKCVETDHVQVIGLQLYSGTQKKTIRKIKKELELLCSMIEQLNEKYSLSMKHVEYGPGLPVEYFEEEQFSLIHEEYEEVCEYIRAISQKWNLTLEMGRYIAATCGCYVTSVVDIKCNKEQNYCIVDGGINHVNYYGQMMAMKKPAIMHISSTNDVTSGEEKSYLICGSLCTTADVIVKDIHLNNLTEGDILVFDNIGAYSVTEGIYLFLSRLMPKILFREQDGTIEVARDYYDTSLLNYVQE